jgi:hypothetical protein
LLSNHVKYRQHIKLRHKSDTKNPNPPKRNQRVRKGLGITQLTKSEKNARENVGTQDGKRNPEKNTEHLPNSSLKKQQAQEHEERKHPSRNL